MTCINKKLIINVLSEKENCTLEFAALELKRYLAKMANEQVEISITHNSSNNKYDNCINLGLYENFNISPTELEDKNLDDAVYAKIDNLNGIISGPNPRSVLFSVYRFLEASGCRWIRPGKDGELIPKVSIFSLCIEINEKAGYRYRGYSTLGTYSIESYIDKIDWSAKMGINSIMNESFLPVKEFANYYGRNFKSIKKPEKRSIGEIMSYHRMGIAEIKKRGLIYNAVGHGWTGVAIGLTEEETSRGGIDTIPEDKAQYLAQVNGHRRINNGSLKHTDLCYGNPKVRGMLVKAICDYAENHQYIDILHFWMSDGIGTHCECERCKDTLPSDFYVMILNAVDEELTIRKLKTRIAFIVYTDTDWAPQKTAFKNQDRFIMLFTNHTRNYQDPYVYESKTATIPPYRRNKNPILFETESFYVVLKEWRKWFQGDSFIWDFHYTNYHFLDQGQYYGNWVMEEDIRRLRKMGINGSLTCSVLRAHYPTSFPIYLFAKMHWKPELSMEQLANEYYQAAFGDGWNQCLEYMKSLSEEINPFNIVPFTKNLPPRNYSREEVIDKLHKIPSIVENYRKVIEKNVLNNNKTHALSWKYIFIHMEMVKLLSYSIRAKIDGDDEISSMYWEMLTEYMMMNENRLDSVLDPWWFFFAFKSWYKLSEPTEDVFL